MKKAIGELKIARERNERRLLEFGKLWPADQPRGEGVTASIDELRASVASIDKAVDVLERYERGGIVDPVLDFQRAHPGAFVPSDRVYEENGYLPGAGLVPEAPRARPVRKGQVGPPPASTYPGMLHGQSLDERADGAAAKLPDARVAVTVTELVNSMGVEGTAFLVDGDGEDE